MEIIFSGKRALVTGAAQGIGLAVVKKLVECGAQVVALDVQEEKLKEAVKELPGVETLVVDMSDWDSIVKSLESTGPLQLIVNNAGIYPMDSVQEIQEDVTNRVLDINLKGVMAVCKHAVNEWTSTGTQGSIVNIGSVAAVCPHVDFLAYSASKAAVVQYTRCLALDCAPKGIRVNAVSPSAVVTDMTGKLWTKPPKITKMVPMEKTLSDPEDIANAVVFLLCDKLAKRITGVNLDVDGGFMLT